jgi:hypothetical protein
VLWPHTFSGRLTRGSITRSVVRSFPYFGCKAFPRTGASSSGSWVSVWEPTRCCTLQFIQQRRASVLWNLLSRSAAFPSKTSKAVHPNDVVLSASGTAHPELAFGGHHKAAGPLLHVFLAEEISTRSTRLRRLGEARQIAQSRHACPGCSAAHQSRRSALAVLLKQIIIFLLFHTEQQVSRGPAV